MNSFLRNALLVCCLAAPLAHAPRAADDKLPAALEGIPPAGSACRRDDDKGETTKNTDKTTKSREDSAEDIADYSCALDADTLQTMRSSPDLMMADLRPPSAFAAFHISGAVNVSPGALAGKSYWKNKRLVLAGGGKGERDLYVQCARLKRRGYSRVHVLRGGIARWHARALPLQGRVPALAAQIRLSAAELWRETLNPRNLVLFDASLSSLIKDVPAAHAVSAPIPGIITGASNTRNRQSQRITAIVLATAAPLDNERIAELSRAAHPIPLLVYNGNADEYRKQLALQRTVWKAHEQGPKTPRCGA